MTQIVLKDNSKTDKNFMYVMSSLLIFFSTHACTFREMSFWCGFHFFREIWFVTVIRKHDVLYIIHRAHICIIRKWKEFSLVFHAFIPSREIQYTACLKSEYECAIRMEIKYHFFFLTCTTIPHRLNYTLLTLSTTPVKIVLLYPEK